MEASPTTCPTTGLLTTKDVATFMKCSPDLVRRLPIPCITLGRLRRYTMPDIESFIRDRRHGS